MRSFGMEWLQEHPNTANPFPDIYLQYLNCSQNIVLRAYSRQSYCLYRWKELIHLLFSRSQGIMVMTELEFCLPNPNHRPLTQRPHCLHLNKQNKMLSPVQMASMGWMFWMKPSLATRGRCSRMVGKSMYSGDTRWIQMLVLLLTIGS